MSNKMRLLLMFILIPFLFSCTKKEEKYSRKGNKIYFGYYPQTLVTNSKTIDKLNKTIKNYPTETNDFEWTNYNYYIEDEASNFMWYLDVDLDNDKKYDYRGVYFIKYRPYYTDKPSEENNSLQLHSDYFINTVYWFKYERIEWDILEENDGKAKLITTNVLDSRDFYPSTSNEKFYHNGGEGNGNDYELSDLRKWLNSGFYNSSFNDNEKALIDAVDNDKVTQLTFDEARTYYTSNEERLSFGSDYAKAQGLEYVANNHSIWVLGKSSEYCSYQNYIMIVGHSGNLIHTEVYSTFMGIRPVIYINL